MDWRQTVTRGPDDQHARESGGNVISLLEYRQRRSGPSDDGPPRPAPRAARAYHINRSGCEAVAGRFLLLAI